jgi:hypothetical protein
MNLDDLIPHPRYRICTSRLVSAAPDVVWDELHQVTMSALPLGRALEGIRLLPARLSGRKLEPLAGRTFFDVTPIPVLFSDRPRVIISAGLSQAWRPRGHAAEHRDPDSRNRSEDSASLRAVLFLISVGSRAIRREVLRIVARRAESPLKAR